MRTQRRFTDRERGGDRVGRAWVMVAVLVAVRMRRAVEQRSDVRTLESATEPAALDVGQMPEQSEQFRFDGWPAVRPRR